MPSVVNGIGTWYYGKRNVHTALGECEACRAYGELTSYDTTMYFVVFFVPLVPLGKKRIVNECPSCQRHRVVGLREWKRTKENELTAVAAALQKSPGDPGVMCEAIGSFVAFQDRSALEAASAAAKRKFGQNADVQLALGSAWMYFGDLKEAETAYRTALTASGGDDEREALAMCLLKQERPDEAAPLLAHIIEKKKRADVGALYLLAMGYQGRGQHQDALKTLDLIVKTFPREEKDRELQRLRKLSTKHAQSGKKIGSLALKRSGTAKEKRLSSPALSAFIGPAIAVLVIAGYLYAAYAQGASRKIYVVNGLSRPYDVEIAGTRHTLHPHRRKEVNIAEGDIRVRVLDDALAIPDQTATIETRFITRPFNDNEYVLNPDRVALVLWEQWVYYSGSKPMNNPKPPRVYVGELLYTFDDIEYMFRKCPQSITTESTSNQFRERIDQLRDFEPAAKINAIVELGSSEKIPDFVKRLATYEPENDFYLHTLVRIMPPEESIAFMRPMLDRRPALVEWHRMYQTFIEFTRPDHDLTAEYKKALDASPDDADLVYLYARALADRNEALPLFAKASRMPKPSAYGAYALCVHALGDADYERALEMGTMAARIAPERDTFAEVRDEALLALRKYEKLIEMRRADQKESPYLVAPVAEEVKLLCLSGASESATKVISAYCARAADQFEKDVIDGHRAYLMATRAYALGDVPGYAKSMEQLDDESFAFELLVASGKLDEASALMSGEESPSADNHAVLHLAAVAAGNDELAHKHFAAYVESLATGTSERRKAHAYLSGGKELDVEEALLYLEPPQSKRTVMTVFGVKFPEHAEKFFAMADKLNYSPTYPQHLVEKVIELRRAERTTE